MPSQHKYGYIRDDLLLLIRMQSLRSLSYTADSSGMASEKSAGRSCRAEFQRVILLGRHH